jgi:hypoxanthine phosphoribosyltransferase
VTQVKLPALLPAGSEKIFERAQIDSAVDALAGGISELLGDKRPLILCIMNGGVPLTGFLMPKLDFALELDYVHASRYRGSRTGDVFQWIRRPPTTIAGRNVLLIDDIFDQGLTLQAVIDACRDRDARSVHTAVLVEKPAARLTERKLADFVALQAPERYLVGFGMDYQGLFRNLEEIYALPNL